MKKQKQGFTLVELLVSMVILTILGTALYGVFSAAHRAVQAGEQLTDISQIARSLLADMQRELRSCYPLEVEVIAPRQGWEEVEETSLYVIFETKNLKDEATGLETDEIRFVTSADDPRQFDEPSADLVSVRYLIDTDPKTPEDGLVREVLLHPPLKGRTVSKEVPKRRELSAWVRSLNFRYYDDEEEKWLDEWKEVDWLPQFIEITIGILPTPVREGRNGWRSKSRIGSQTEFFTTAVNLPLRVGPVVPESWEFIPNPEEAGEQVIEEGEEDGGETAWEEGETEE